MWRHLPPQSYQEKQVARFLNNQKFMTLTSFVNNTFSILTMIALAISTVLVVSLFYKPLRQMPFVSFFSRRSLLVGFVISLLATIGSLTYSDVIGYAPCVLCWFQRIFMYPQIILMGIAVRLGDRLMHIYGLVLSIIGGTLALWHYLGQLGFGSLPCSAVGYSVSCAERFVMQYGFITIPMMALSAFLLMSLSYGLSIIASRDSQV